MLSMHPVVKKNRTIAMLTSCNQSIALHFTEKRPQIHQFFPFFPVFSHFSYALIKNISLTRQSIHGTDFFKKYENLKLWFFFANIIFLKVKKDMLFMSFFKKKDRMFTTFFPASFHLTGLVGIILLASNIAFIEKIGN